MSKQKRKVAKQTAAQTVGAEARELKVRRFQAALGGVIVGLTAVAAIVMSALGQLPVPVAVGVVLLVALRLYILRREIKRQPDDCQGLTRPH